MDGYQGRLELWGKHAPDNYAAKWRICQGLVAGARGDGRAARQMLREGAEYAAKCGNGLEEALGFELLAQSYADEGANETARAWTVRAHQAYSVWGARTKAAQLWSDHDLEVASVTSAARAPTQAMRAATVQHRAASGVIASQPVVTTSSRTAADLDLDSVLKASQTIAGEVVFDKLLAKMMAVVIENGGAERAVLLAVDHDHIEVTAQMATGDHNVPREAMALADAIAQGVVPGAVVLWVARSREVVVLDDASEDARFVLDPYVQQRGSKSVLALPLLHQGVLSYILYLENDMAIGAFTARRLGTLELLTGQIATSLANARLFEQTSALERANARFVPYEFLQALNRTNIVEVRRGDHVRKEMSMFFSDIRGFTALVEHLSPEATLQFVNDYLAVAEAPLLANGGFIDKYLGDGILALFDGSADNAVRGAIAMHKALEGYNVARRARGLADVRTGIGINTGSVVLGTLGGKNALQCSVVGDAVNLASRIESLTKRYGATLLISEATFERLALPVAYATRRIGRVQVVGKSLPVTVYEVLDTEAPEDRAAKLATLTAFEAGLEAYFKGDMPLAVARFSDCCVAAPADLAAAHLLQSARAIQAAGVPADWDGVERMNVK